MSYKVVVLQTSRSGFSDCREALESSSLPEGSWFITMNPQTASTWIQTNERQLLVIGGFIGDQEASDNYVHRERIKNSRLVTVCFSIESSWGEIYDQTIPMIILEGSKTTPLQDLIEYIRQFLDRCEADPSW